MKVPLIRQTVLRMFRLGTLMFVLIMTSGCEFIWTVPPARGRVVDSRSQQPVAGAQITRMSYSTNRTTSAPDGRFRFRGRRSVQFFPFGDALAWASYRIEATGYLIIETNRYGYGSVSGLRHDFGKIQLSPK
jgi:hypothetical protein